MVASSSCKWLENSNCIFDIYGASQPSGSVVVSWNFGQQKLVTFQCDQVRWAIQKKRSRTRSDSSLSRCMAIHIVRENDAYRASHYGSVSEWKRGLFFVISKCIRSHKNICICSTRELRHLWTCKQTNKRISRFTDSGYTCGVHTTIGNFCTA